MGEKRGTKTTQRSFPLGFCHFLLLFLSFFLFSFLIFISLFILNNEVSTHIQFFNNNIMCILF